MNILISTFGVRGDVQPYVAGATGAGLRPDRARRDRSFDVAQDRPGRAVGRAGAGGG